MKKLYEPISIDTWNKIADRVKTLKLSNNSNKEYIQNLYRFKELLSDLDISLDEGKKEPYYNPQIGLSSLLSAIYNTSIIPEQSIGDFQEYIYALNDLGVQSIEYRPINFPKENRAKLEFYDDYTHLQKVITKCYTDGKFSINRPDIFTYSDCNKYVITNLDDASYSLTTTVCHKRPYRDEKPQVLESKIIIKNFKGNLPSKEELLKIEFPKLKIHTKKISWGESPIYSQLFKEYDFDEIENVKKLTK